MSFALDSLVANAHALVDSIVKAMAAAKGKYLRTVTVSSTMGPGVNRYDAHRRRRQALRAAVLRAPFFVLREHAARSTQNLERE